LSTYYDILGISQLAGINEVKRAFRRLAKLYHPDKNPGEKELFARILKAYETLVDPTLRSAYDRKLTHQQHQKSSGQNTKSKTWTFEEKELRRRKYYEEHIKKFEKVRPTYPTPESPKNTYNEFKYILFATPLAVALLLLVIHLAESPEKKTATPNYKTTGQRPIKKIRKDFSSPFGSTFGQQKVDPNSKLSFLLSNEMGLDVVFCLFKKDKFVKSVFLPKDSLVQLRQIQSGKYTARLAIGKDFDPDKSLLKGKVKGGFAGDVFFYFTKSSFTLDADRKLSLGRDLYKSLVQVDEQVFFETKQR
jgi:curved DNA-binding protein CbpA